jgi:transposase
MTSNEETGQVFGGVDTHDASIHVAVISDRGRDLGDREFPTTAAGYRRALAFVASYGDVAAIGIEGSSSYGAGITRAALADGMVVVEVMRPDRAERRRLGKSDPIDAYQAARAAASAHRVSPVKDPAAVEGIRALHNARRSAIKARTAAMVQIFHQLVVAPDDIRDKYRDLAAAKRITALARMRIATTRPVAEQALLEALKTLAVRCQSLTAEHEQLGTLLDQLVTDANPGLRGAYGVGPDTGAQLLITAGGNPERFRSEAAFAALCGASPIPASSGKTVRHRLNRGGDRAANGALHRIALVRMSSDPRTRAYVTRQREKGLSSKEIQRKLKRAIAREIFRYLATPTSTPAIDDLRPLRRSKNLTLTAAADHFAVWPAVISQLERGLRRDDTLANNYRQWLHAA